MHIYFIFVQLHIPYVECVEPLGMQNGDIKDNQITATSSRSADLPHYGRLHNNKYWCAAKKSKNEYIQVDLGQVSKIKIWFFFYVFVLAWKKEHYLHLWRIPSHKFPLNTQDRVQFRKTVKGLFNRQYRLDRSRENKGIELLKNG